MKNNYQEITITLQVEKDFEGKKIKHLVMRPPTTADVILADKLTDNSLDKEVLLFANLSDKTSEFIKELAFYDYRQVEAAFNCFLLPIAQHLDQRSLLFQESPEAPQ